jgi:hypothetical protein
MGTTIVDVEGSVPIAVCETGHRLRLVLHELITYREDIDDWLNDVFPKILENYLYRVNFRAMNREVGSLHFSG